MRTSRLLLVSILAVPLAAIAAPEIAPDPAKSLPTLAELAPETVATVNGKPLTRDQLGALAAYAYGRTLLDELISQELVRQEAVRLGVTVTVQEVEEFLRRRVDEELNRQAQRLGAKDFADLRTKGIAEERLDALRDRAESRLRPTAWLGLLAFKMVAQSVNVTEEQVRAEFDRLYGAKARGRQIVVAAREQADEVVDILNKGAEFASVAQDRSLDRVTARNGGEMPPLAKGSALGDALFALRPGRVSQPVQTRDGFHVLKLIEITPAAVMKFADAQEAIRASLVEQETIRVRDQWLLGLMEKAEIRRMLNSEIAAPAQNAPEEHP